MTMPAERRGRKQVGYNLVHPQTKVGRELDKITCKLRSTPWHACWALPPKMKSRALSLLPPKEDGVPGTLAPPLKPTAHTCTHDAHNTRYYSCLITCREGLLDRGKLGGNLG